MMVVMAPRPALQPAGNMSSARHFVNTCSMGIVKVRARVTVFCSGQARLT